MLIRSLPTGVKLLPVPSHGDGRGRLHAIEQSGPIPFQPIRMFVIRDVPAGAWRARHAVSCHEFLWMMAGACTLDVDNGTSRATLRLQAEGPGALVSSGVWMELREFTEDAVVSVFASTRYADTQYFPTPNPDILIKFD
jgi:UDP-2-acetamido-3-amino-2,3-dideoxy-glucuronate N-acetyltransferase